MADEQERSGPEGDLQNGRRRRRRRRRRRSGEEGPATGAPRQEWGDEFLLENGEERGARRGRRHPTDADPAVNVPGSGKNPSRKRSTRAKRAPPGSAAGRRRGRTQAEVEVVSAWIARLPDPLLSAMYRGLGGQSGRISERDRVVQLLVRAITQSNRVAGAVKQLHDRERDALAALVQAGGVAQADEFHRELGASYGGNDREWSRAMHVLAERGLAFAAAEQDGQFFYAIPEVLIDAIIPEIGPSLRLPEFRNDEVRVLDHRPFCPPLDFSITTLATYIDQHRPRLTQRHEIHRHDQEEMDRFFGQLWEPESELFSFHIDFLMMHGMVQLRGDTLALDRDAMEEWLQLEPEDQRDLVFRALHKRFPHAEWVLWALHEANGAWVAERPLVAMYRRWKRGEDWRERLAKGQHAPTRTHERESYSFAPLVSVGLLEMGQWGQEKFYRLSSRGLVLLDPPEDEGFRQFYLTPSFEVMAPAGLAPILLFRIGELAELTGCDRANTYKITETMVNRALERGWRRDDILQFLRDNSQIGVPDNVEATLKGWIGHRGDVEFHDLLLMTVHRSQIRRLEGNRRIKPYLLHRFAPGMYAVDRNRVAEIETALRDSSFDPAKEHHRYPGDPGQVEARQQLLKQVAEAREAAVDPSTRATEGVAPEKLQPVPGTRSRSNVPAVEEVEDAPSLTSPADIRTALDRAMARDLDVEMVYLAKSGQKLTCKVRPERLAFKSDAPVLVGLDRVENERRTFLLERIERLKVLEK